MIKRERISLRRIIVLSVLSFFFFLPFVLPQGPAVEAMFNEGVEYYNQGLRRLAAENFRKVLGMYPQHEGAQRYLGMIGHEHVERQVREASLRYEPITRDPLPDPRAFEPQPRNLDYYTSSEPYLKTQAQEFARQRIEEEARQEAAEDFSSMHNIRQEAVAAARTDHQVHKQRMEEVTSAENRRTRREVVNKALDDEAFKMSIGYMFMRGEQSFRLLNTVYGGNLSKLTYPIKGGMGMASAEIKLMPRLFAGGRFAASNFRKNTSKDEDWNFPQWFDDPGEWKLINYHLTEQDAKSKAFFWNADLYYRMFDWSRDDLGKYLSELFLVDRMYLDAFAGYQYYKGKHTMVDPTTKHIAFFDDSWWYVPTPYSDGLNSWYEVEYKGPRTGLRLGGALTEKLSSSLSFSYAWLRTNAHAYWNLRDFRWRHEGKGWGSAFNADIEAQYHVTPNWFLGAGFHYMQQKHSRSLYSGTQPAGSFTDLDIARDTKMHLYGLSLQTGYRW